MSVDRVHPDGVRGRSPGSTSSSSTTRGPSTGSRGTSRPNVGRRRTGLTYGSGVPDAEVGLRYSQRDRSTPFPGSSSYSSGPYVESTSRFCTTSGRPSSTWWCSWPSTLRRQGRRPRTLPSASSSSLWAPHRPTSAQTSFGDLRPSGGSRWTPRLLRPWREGRGNDDH